MNIIISPLNWGLGHASRISAIIYELNKSHSVTIAADGESFDFLKNEFPENLILKAPHLKIKYSKKRILMPIKLFLALPKLFYFFLKNRIWITKYLKSNNCNLIISDNRFGFYSKKTKSIFISHQIKIKTGNFITEKIAFFLNKINIEKFDELWIPDSKETKISGELSDEKKIKIPVKYIGIISRFSLNDNIQETDIEEYEILAIVSGPEPQRSIFEELLIKTLSQTNYKTLLIQGKPHFRKEIQIKNILVKNHEKSIKLAKIISKANIIISRSGYSTIMDLIKLKKSAILIPTPGQTEQEFLANYLHTKNIFFYQNQKNFTSFDIEKYLKIKPELENNINKIESQNNINPLFEDPQ